MDSFIDLHIHTTCSDGSLDVYQVLQEACRAGLSVISITDHDSVGAYSQLKSPKIRDAFHGRIIPGVEFTTTYNGELVEVLGYGINTDVISDFISQNILSPEKEIIERSALFMSAYEKYGVTLDAGFVRDMKNDPLKIFANHRSYWQAVFLDNMRKFPQNARFFASKDEFENLSAKDFTRNFIYNPKSTLYVDMSPLFPSFGQIVDIIHKSGGHAFLAHTYVYSPSIANSLENIIGQYPLDGLEYSYPTFSKAQSGHIAQVCKKHGLYRSCGSDFHGLDIKPDNKLGLGTENERLTYSVIKPWADNLDNEL